jgi:hypothetical protein
MTRLLLLIVLCLVTWYYFPESRAILLDAAEPIVVRVARWSSREEMLQVGRNALAQERLTGHLPTGGAWLPWLEYRYATEEARQDPWGSTYQLQATADSVFVISFGPDRIRGSEDDILVSTPRR